MCSYPLPLGTVGILHVDELKKGENGSRYLCYVEPVLLRCIPVVIEIKFRMRGWEWMSRTQ